MSHSEGIVDSQTFSQVILQCESFWRPLLKQFHTVQSCRQQGGFRGKLQLAYTPVGKPHRFPRGPVASRALLSTAQEFASWFSRRSMGSQGSGKVSFIVPEGSKWWDTNTVAVVTGGMPFPLCQAPLCFQ
jgi:hypothetical protein